MSAAMSPASDEAVCREGAGRAEPAAAAGPPEASTRPPDPSAVAAGRGRAHGRGFRGILGMRMAIGDPFDQGFWRDAALQGDPPGRTWRHGLFLKQCVSETNRKPSCWLLEQRGA